jgi:uncharacterized protein YbjT (DUF2867 family)
MAPPHSSQRPRRLFIAGSTGATGRTLLRISGPHRSELVAFRRPRGESDQAKDASEAVLPLDDREALVSALRGCTTAVQLIGTMRKRFAKGDTYETSDIGTTRSLVEASREAGVDHLVLLSSVGAGKPMGAYLEAKAKAETLVRESGIPYTIFRPSAFMGEEHRVPEIAETITKLFGMDRYRPIRLEDLARVILYAGLQRAPLKTELEGAALWQWVDEAKRAL